MLEQPSSLGAFIAYAAGTGLAAAVFNQIIQLVRERRQRDQAAAYLAVRLSFTLEMFVLDALEASSEALQMIEERITSEALRAPIVPEYPNDPDGWRALDKNVATRAINLRLVVAERYRDVAFNAQFEGFLDAAEAYSEEAILCGLDAWLLAQEIRNKYKLPNYGYVHRSDAGSKIGLFLENRANAITAKRRSVAAGQSDLC